MLNSIKIASMFLTLFLVISNVTTFIVFPIFMHSAYLCKVACFTDLCFVNNYLMLSLPISMLQLLETNRFDADVPFYNC